MQSELNVKICSKCSVEKSAREYGKASRSKDGLHWWCKMCVRQYRKDNISRYSMLHVKYPETYRRSRKVWRENAKDQPEAAVDLPTSETVGRFSVASFCSFVDYASDTEIGPERLCSDCEHEFGAD